MTSGIQERANSLFRGVAGTVLGKDRDSQKYEALPVSHSADDYDLEIAVDPLPSSALQQKQENTTFSMEDGDGEHSCTQTVVGWSCMVLAVIASASVGPVFKHMMAEGIPALQAASWRNQTMVLSLLPFALFEAWSKKSNQVDWFGYKPDLPFPVIVHVLVSGLSWSANLLFWIVGLQYVTTFKASVISSSHPVLLVIALRCSGHNISLAEWLGVTISFGGMFLSEYRPSSSHAELVEETTPFHLQLFGYSLCLLAAAGEVVTILNRIKTRKYVPLLQYTTFTSFVVALCATILAVCLEGSKFLEDGEICYGPLCLLGWMAPAWRAKMLLFGLWIGAVCITGFNYAMQYIPPLVFSSVTLVDPAVTAFISWIFGIESLPGIFSWFGGAVVVAGVVVIGYGERKRQEAAKRNSDDRIVGTALEGHTDQSDKGDRESAKTGGEELDGYILSHHNTIHSLELSDKVGKSLHPSDDSRIDGKEVEMLPVSIISNIDHHRLT
eukprot:gene3713-4062_t